MTENGGRPSRGGAMRQGPGGTDNAPPQMGRAYAHLLGVAHQLSLRTLGRVAELRRRYPDDLRLGTPDPAPAPGDPIASGAPERRSHPRAHCRPVRVSAHGVDSPALLQALLVEESASGVGLWSPDLVPVGAVVYLLRADAPPGALGTLVRVRHCRAEGGGWVLGCRLLHTPGQGPIVTGD